MVRDAEPMFISHSLHLQHPLDRCIAALARGPRTWFPGLSDDKVSPVGVRVAGVPVRKRVSVELGEPASIGNWVEIPLTWTATSARKLFPVLTGKVVMAPVEPGVTRLTVSGMYEPPFGRLGREIDEVLMHSVADATIKDLAESIAERLEGVVA